MQRQPWVKHITAFPLFRKLLELQLGQAAQSPRLSVPSAWSGKGKLGLQGHMRPFNQLRPELSPKETGGSPMEIQGQIHQ